MLARLALLAVLALAFVSQAAAATAPFALCYKINSFVPAAALTLDSYYSVAVELVGTYNTAVGNSKYGTFVNLTTITSGTRNMTTRYGTKYIQAVSSLAPVGTDFADNVLYLSNGTQWVDGDGITYLYTKAIEFPGSKEVSNTVNIYRSGGHGIFVEDKTGGINSTGTSFAVANGDLTTAPDLWTGARYTQGQCYPNKMYGAPAANPNPGTASYTVDVKYFLTDGSSWNVSFNGSFTTAHGTVPQDAFGDYRFNLSTVTGIRTYCTFGSLSHPTCGHASATTITPYGTFGFVDNYAYDYAPFLDYNGPGYNLSAVVPKPGAVYGTTLPFNTTNAVNIYVSKSGEFFEGFGNKGTLSNGFANPALTKLTVTELA